MKKFVIKKLLNIYRVLKKLDFDYYYEGLRNNYQIAEDFKFNGEGVQFYGEGKILIEDGSYIGSYSTIQAAKGCSVSIGRNCAISHNVRIYTTSNISDVNWTKDKKISFSKNVTIEDYVWIGANVFINPGVRIGENSIVGANAVVTKDIPPNAIYGGIPAKLIRYKP